MNRVISHAPERVAQFVGERVGQPIIPPFVGIGLERDGQLVAGAVFNVYTGPDVQVTVAAEPGAITRAFVRACGEYAFGVAGCERVSIETGHPFVARLALRLGGRVEGVKRNAFGPGLDAFVVGILKADWKF
jgi:hypothetical protein